MASTSNLLSSYPIRAAKFSGTGATLLFSTPPSRNSEGSFYSATVPEAFRIKSLVAAGDC
ncbi:hypothetical protein DCAR_0833138 [Daucus carota subsp. sativus]|uniref:Uncharacterized protein n=1 Tax=Daucus carota subsp. sativus TaxID=79200 RepID=A0A175YRD5_DAUCS|nr:hypothetical protein DCAR_0833138 [Daucus carota subsp. sativus]